MTFPQQPAPATSSPADEQVDVIAAINGFVERFEKWRSTMVDDNDEPTDLYDYDSGRTEWGDDALEFVLDLARRIAAQA